MEKIPPKERFSQNVRSISTPVELLQKALTQFRKTPTSFELKQLSGGFMNANFLASGEGQNFVLRVYASDAQVAQKEFDLLQFLQSKSILTPKVFGNFEVHGRPVVIMEYLNGMTLEDRILEGIPLNLSVYEEIGQQLGKIHSIHFAKAGFIGPQMKMNIEFDNFSRFIGDFMKKTLKELEARPDKLDIEMNARFCGLIRDKWDSVVQTETTSQLVHCDFNPKNILVSNERDAKLIGIIDWEFADSGNGLIDIGNFFRFSYDYPEEARKKFIKGYKTTNSNLHPDWENASRLIDLGNMCGFLERKEDYQKSFRTARAVIKSTLEHFGY
ncbi:MAG: aminoglycoside phosphotransferase family protein [Pseudobdellovibrionaceae bacterium]